MAQPNFVSIMSSDDPIAVGDYVLVNDPQAAGQRGYVSQIIQGRDPRNQLFNVVLSLYGGGPPQTILNVRAGDLRLLQRQNEIALVSVKDHSHDSPALFGTADVATRRAWHSVQKLATQPGSPYAKLPRIPLDEMIIPNSDDCIIRDDETRTHYHSVFQGKNIVLEWAFRFDDEEGFSISSATPIMDLDILEKLPDESYKPMGRVCYKHAVACSISAPHDSLWNDPNISHHQKELLALRFIHMLLRLAGCEIGPSLSASMATYLCETYKSRCWWRLHLDSFIGLADVCLFMQPASFCNLSFPLAEVLRENKMFLQAADLLSQFASICASHAASGTVDEESSLPNATCHQLVLLARSGHLYVMKKHFEAAEHTYLFGLRTLFQKVSGDSAFNGAHGKELIQGLVEVYAAWATEHNNRDVLELGLLLINMRMLAGVHDFADPGESERLTLRDGQSIIAEVFHNSGVAKSSLRKAHRAESAELFRAEVFSWSRTGNTEDCDQPLPKIFDFKVSRKEAKMLSRCSQYGGRVDSQQCDNPECDSSIDLHQCAQCKSVVYW
jgi:hypothetical protein